MYFHSLPFLIGIPDYRSEGVGLYARSNSRPTQHFEFIRSPKVRQRYWARNFVAWPHFSNIQPNETHKALARLQRNGHIGTIVTQNVDRLHTKAGSKNVLELHGCGYKVICLGSHCDYFIDRHELQLIFNTMNQSLVDRVDLMRPDGDVDIPQVNYTKKFNHGNLIKELSFLNIFLPISSSHRSTSTHFECPIVQSVVVCWNRKLCFSEITFRRIVQRD